MFFGVTVYGLFHGLVLLPVLLSLVGPEPYLAAGADIEMTSARVKRPAEVNGAVENGGGGTGRRRRDVAFGSGETGRSWCEASVEVGPIACWGYGMNS